MYNQTHDTVKYYNISDCLYCTILNKPNTYMQITVRNTISKPTANFRTELSVICCHLKCFNNRQ